MPKIMISVELKIEPKLKECQSPKLNRVNILLDLGRAANRVRSVQMDGMYRLMSMGKVLSDEDELIRTQIINRVDRLAKSYQILSSLITVVRNNYE